MRDPAPHPILLKDYSPPPFRIPRVALDVDVRAGEVLVRSTLTIEPTGNAKLVYFAGSLPDDTRTSAKKGESFSGACYNVDPNVPVKVKVTSPKCAALPFPIDDNGITFTGNQSALPGDAVAYLRMFIGAPLAIADAGTD